MNKIVKIIIAVAACSAPILAVMLGIALSKGCAVAPEPTPTEAIIKIHQHAGQVLGEADEINAKADESKADVLTIIPLKVIGYTPLELGEKLDRYSRGTP